MSVTQKDIVILHDSTIFQSNATKRKLFRKAFKENKFDDINHIVINPVSLNEIEEYKPKIVFCLGKEYLHLFNITEKIHKVAGVAFARKSIDGTHQYAFIVSYDFYDIDTEEDVMYQIIYGHFQKLSKLYFKHKSKSDNKIVLNQDNVLDKCYSYKLPDWCYDENHILIDIQNNKFENKLVFTFRSKDGKKKYHYENSRKNYFYTYPMDIKESNVIRDITDVEVHFKKQGLLENGAIYEGDVAQELKHSIDYYYNRKVDEISYELNILYWDIEVYTGDYAGFPFALVAAFPINSISFKLNLDGKTYVYILVNDDMDKTTYTNGSSTDIENLQSKLRQNKDISHYEIVLFDSEEELIKAFLSKAKEFDPDLWSGWNTDTFDIPYLVNRMHKNNISCDLLSPINEADVDISHHYGVSAYGVYFTDQMTLYKKLSQNVEESYKLSSISQKVLGKDKIAYEGTLNNVYREDLVKFILYSGTDTELLAELENSLNHIKLNFELIKTCCSTWKRSETTSGVVDPLLLKFAKDRNKVCRNRVYNSLEQFSGAYVIPPKVGMHNWVCDFDFKSLYPSIIRSLNIGPNTYKAKISEEHGEMFLYNFDKLPEKIEVTIDPILKSRYYISMTPTELKEFIEKNNYIISINGCMFLQHETELSFFYEILEYLGNQRDAYKKALGDLRQKVNAEKDSFTQEELDLFNIQLKQFDNKQNTYKIISNSIYGIIAMPYFRMFNIDLAKAITYTGKEALKYSVLHLSNYMKYDDITINKNFLKDFENKVNDDESDLPYIAYGDTDSMFVQIGEYLMDNDLI